MRSIQRGLYGERTYDAANTLCNPYERPDLVYDEARFLRNATLLADHMAIELSRVLSFTLAYAALSASWSLEDDDDPTHPLNVATLADKQISTAT